jgi:uncharacterized cupredoxin-like copper-binding protein
MYSKTITSSLFAASLVLAAASGAAPAFAAGAHSGGHGGKKGHAMSFGEPGKASAVSRTIEIKMFDNYYEPKEITVKAGETIRFVVKNVGEFVHEFNIGTAAMHAAHQEEMMTMMEHGMLEVDKINHDKMKMDGHSMAHDDPNSVLFTTPG